jgi:histidine phosphotransfer protein HptB
MAKVDLTMLAQLHELLGERYVELVSCFCGDGKRRIDLIREAILSFNSEVIYAEAHGLKGTSYNVGANDLAEHCAALELGARQNDHAAITTLFAAMEQEFAAVCIVLKKSLQLSPQ